MNAKNAFLEIMRLPVGTVVSLWVWGRDGAGYMGRWMVGALTLWDVEYEIAGKAVPTKKRNPAILRNQISRWTRAGHFATMGKKKRDRILRSLRRKNAERGNLEKTLEALASS